MKLWKVFIVLVIVLALGSWGSYFFLFGPSRPFLSSADRQKTLKQLLGRDPHTAVEAIDTGLTQYKSARITFRYPKSARVYTIDNTKATGHPDTLDSFSFGLLDEHVYGVVQAVRFTDHLSEYPAVNVRLQQTDVYTAASQSADTISFTKTQDMVEHSIFYKKGYIVVSVAVTGYSQKSVDDLYRSVTTSLEIF